MKNSVRNLFRHASFRPASFRRTRPATLVAGAVLAVAATSGGVFVGAPETGPVNTAQEVGITGNTTDLGNVLGAEAAAAVPVPPAPPAQAAPPEAGPPAVPAEAAPPAKPKAPSEKVLEHDFQYQPNFYYCGPAATRIALSGQGVALSQDDLATRLGTTVNGTNSSLDVVRVLNAVLGKDVYQVREVPGQAATPAEMDRLQADVVEAIGNGRIVVANIVGSATDTSGFSRSFPGGHYVTIVGYSDDGRRVRVADPSGVGPATYWMTTIDMAHWVAARGYSY